MAIIKKSKMREMSDEELSAKLFEYQKELNAERGMLASGGRTSNPGKMRELRRTLARALTIQHERKLGIRAKAGAGKDGEKEEKKK
jgi:large subunit ribosomal protein L29